MPGEWDAECTSGFFVHIDCMGTSCHTSSSSSHNCYKQLAFYRRTWVLSLAVGDPLRCFGCGRVRCSGVVEDLYEQVSLNLRGRLKRGCYVPSGEAHMASKAFERFDIGVYS